jgi:hypothetical protein
VEVIPLTLSGESLGESQLGTLVEVAGGGVGTPQEFGVAFGLMTLVAVEPLRVQVLAENLDGTSVEPGRGLCRGDSGGPFLRQTQDDAWPSVVAVSSTGAEDCLGPDWGARTEVVASWLVQVLAQPLPGSAVPCDASDQIHAYCDSGVALRCRHGWWRERDCRDEGLGCGWMGPSLDFDCIPAACGEVDANGLCEASGTAVYCTGSELRRHRCPAVGQICGFSETLGGHRCLDDAGGADLQPSMQGLAQDGYQAEPAAAKLSGGCTALAGGEPWPYVLLLLGALLAVARNGRVL